MLRIEDTDLERSDRKYEAEIFESFRWLGIDADESPEKGGPYAPYRQSERIASYRPYLERLLAGGYAFVCPHSAAELETEKQRLMAEKKPPLHICAARDRGSGEGIIRFKTPAGRTIAFTDLIRGEISFASDLLGDFSLAKSLEVPLYNFAVVVDDHEMAISHVIRGEDHIPNTPKQLLLIEALGFTPPAFAHLPLILGPDRSKLSKRHGATAIREFREVGYLPDALVNFMALLGWNPGGEREIFSMEELMREFDLSKVQKSGAVCNGDKLDWLNGAYIRAKTPDELAVLASVFLPAEAQGAEPEYMRRVAALAQPRMKRLSDITNVAYFFRPPEYPGELLYWKQMTDEGAAESLGLARRIIQRAPEADFTAQGLEKAFFKEIGSGDKGAVLWPLRVALSGKKASAGPFEIMAVLGKERTIMYVDRAFRLLGKQPPAERHG